MREVGELMREVGELMKEVGELMRVRGADEEWAWDNEKGRGTDKGWGPYNEQ